MKKYEISDKKHCSYRFKQDLKSKEITKLLYELKERDERIINLLSDINEKERLLNESNCIIKANLIEYKKTRKTLNEQKDEINRLSFELNKIHNSSFWKIALKYYNLRDRSVFKYFFNLLRLIKKRKIVKEIKEVLNQHKENTIIILPPLVDWNIPLFQRPQHIAKRLANRGFLYFFCTNNDGYDSINGIKQIYDNCYLTNEFKIISNLISKKHIIHICSTDMNYKKETVIKNLNKGNLILYEYIDEIHEDITGVITDEVIDRHRYLLSDERCIVVATADKLYKEVRKYRKNNCELITNGVDYEHFSKSYLETEIPVEMKKILSKGKPIIGYFGALAKWFDYELVEKLAEERDYEIVLIGPMYDESVKKKNLSKYDNISLMGSIDYEQLPKYAKCFDISTIPFVINDITESTSPIKLFEYMALGNPIVTTNMPECRKYKSVLIGKDHDDFISKIDEALKLKNDENYKSILYKEALENTWEAKGQRIAELIKANL